MGCRIMFFTISLKVKSDPGNTTPIKGLYIVGDGAKGKGGIEVEGVALGVENTIGLLQNFKTNYAR